MDIVEDLRTTERSSNPKFFNRAADEIETLRAQLAACKWPMCQSESYQKDLGEQISNALVTGYETARLEGFNEGVEAAADKCEEYAADKFDQYKGRGKYPGNNPNRADAHTQGESCGAEDCATQIHALKREVV